MNLWIQPRFAYEYDPKIAKMIAAATARIQQIRRDYAIAQGVSIFDVDVHLTKEPDDSDYVFVTPFLRNSPVT